MHLQIFAQEKLVQFHPILKIHITKGQKISGTASTINILIITKTVGSINNIYQMCSNIKHIMNRKIQVNLNKPLAKFIGKSNKIKRDRKSTRLNSSHVAISYAVFCLKKKI